MLEKTGSLSVCRSEYRWETTQPRSLSIKRHRVGTTCPCIERSDQNLFKFSGAAFEGKDSIEDLLLVLNFKRVGGEKILEMRGDLGRVLLQEAAQRPNNFEHCNQTNEPQVIFAQRTTYFTEGLSSAFRSPSAY
jgi:hypothetical protein